jgi:tyrosine-protein kinase Etk/Wzc
MEQTNSPGKYDLTSDDSIDVKRYISLFISNWYWFAISLFITLSIAYGINRYSEKIYSVSSTLLIKDDQKMGNISGNEAFIPGGEYFKSNQNLKNEIGILKSYNLNLRTIDSLPNFHIVYVSVGKRGIVESKLYDTCPFIIIAETGNHQPPNGKITLKIISEKSYCIGINGNLNLEKPHDFGETINEDGFKFVVNLRNPDHFKFNSGIANKYFFQFVSKEGVANQYRGMIDIAPIEKEASIVRLTLSGPVAQQESDYLNKLMDLYIKQGLELKNKTAENTIKFIDDQLKLISSSLSKAESNLEQFKLDNKVIDLSREGGLIQNRLERYESEKSILELQKKYYEYLKEYLASKNETGDIVSPTVMGVTDVQLLRMVQELSQLQQQKKQLAMNLGNVTTPLALIEDGIERLKISLNENVEGGLGRITTSISVVKNKINLEEAEVRKLPVTERQMINFQRKFDIDNAVYTFLLQKQAEAGIAKASNVSDNRIIDYANVFNSGMVKPKMNQNYMLAFILGFFIPMLGIFLIDYLNNKIIDKKDVEKRTEAPVIGYISHNNYRSEIPVVEKKSSTLAESFRAVRTNLRYFVKDNQNPVVAVSSTISAEGKTFTSINLAAITAMLGKKVLLIGLDLRKPRIHKVLNVDNEKGMSSYLSGIIDYKETIQATKIENLFYAPSGPIPPNPAELIESDRMKDFIEKAKDEFEYIIIDTPPIAIVTDALLVSQYVDLYIMVVRQRYSSRNTLELIQELYKNERIKNLGIIINDISLTGYYGYGLRYGYSMGYGYTYGYSYYGDYVYGKYQDRNSKGSYYTDDKLET